MPRFWVFDPDKHDAHGPYEVADLKRLPGLSPETMVAPDGAASADTWRPANTYVELRNLFGKAPPLPKTPTQRPEASNIKATPERGDSTIITLAAFILAWVNVAWQVWIVQVVNYADVQHELKKTFWVYTFLMFAPALSMLAIASAARRRVIRTGSVGSMGVLTTIAVTIDWIVFIIIGVIWSMYYAGVQSGS